MTQRQQPQAQTMKYIDHACHTSVLSKCHHSYALLIYYFFVIYQANTLIMQNKNKTLFM